jgi:predicted nicotinamide N-methyase
MGVEKTRRVYDASTDDAEFAGYRVRLEHFRHANFQIEMLLPESSEELIDEAEFGADERLPYWAELWPSARALACHLLERRALPDRALELGAGIGLPSLALLHRGVDVLATDYYPEALRFARHNARRNHLPTLRTADLDWRDHSSLPTGEPLVIAADVLYEQRNAEALLGLLPRIVAADGAFLLADPGRVYLGEFLRAMGDAGWTVHPLEVRTEASPGGAGREVTVQLLSFTPADCLQGPKL